MQWLIEPSVSFNDPLPQFYNKPDLVMFLQVLSNVPKNTLKEFHVCLKRWGLPKRQKRLGYEMTIRHENPIGFGAQDTRPVGFQLIGNEYLIRSIMCITDHHLVVTHLRLPVSPTTARSGSVIPQFNMIGLLDPADQ